MPAERDRGCVWAERFHSASDVVANGGTIASVPAFSIDTGGSFDGTDDSVTYTGDNVPVVNIKSVSFWITLATTTENLIKLSGTHSISVSGGTLAATGFTAPTIEIDGVATTTIAADGWHFVTCRSATAFSVDDFVVGEIASFGEFSIRGLKLWRVELLLQENADYHDNATFSYMDRAVVNLPMLMQDHDATNDKTLNRGTLGSSSDADFGATTAEPTKLTYRRGYSFDDGDALDVPYTGLDLGTKDFAIAFHIKPASTSGFPMVVDMGSDADSLAVYFSNADAIRARANSGSSQATYTVSASYWLQEHTVAVTRIGAVLSIYVDGELRAIDASASSSMPSTNSFSIGNINGGTTTGEYAGIMFSFALWYDQSLTPMQVADLYLRMMKGINVI